MENQNLGVAPEWPGEPRSHEAEKSTDSVGTPLTDQETVGFYRVLQEERDKRQALEKELEIFKSGEAPLHPPSVDGDLGTTVYANNLRVSRRFAEAEYGRAVVSAVHDWAVARCDNDPSFNARMRASDDPYEAAKATYDQEKQHQNVNRPHNESLPPRSLADAPGNGAVGKPFTPVGDGNAYDSLFK